LGAAVQSGTRRTSAATWLPRRGGNHAEAVSILAHRLTAIADDVRARAAAIAGAADTRIVTELADGLYVRIDRLQAT
jgi:hypothetical protein